MIGSVLIGADQMQDNSCQIFGTCGGTILILSYSKSSALICGLQNTVYKVISLSEDPVASDDKVLVGKLLHIILPGALGFSVNSLRVCIVKLRVRLLCQTVKNVVCGKLHHLCPCFSCYKA